MYITLAIMKKILNEYFKNILERIQNYQNNASGVQHNQYIIDLPYLNEFIKIHINNLGDPFFTPKIPLDPHTFPEERKVIQIFSEFLNLNPEKIWGYCSSCGSEGNLSGVRYGREIISQKYNVTDKTKITLFYSKASHYSVPRAGDLLNIKLQTVETNHNDEIDIADMERIILENIEYYRENGIVLSLTLGTTMTCGYDSVNDSLELFKKLNIEKKFVHVDGALGGLITPFFDITKTDYNNIDSFAVSGHKILGLPFPSGIFLTKKEYWDLVCEYTPYISKKDGTLFGSRNGLAVLYLYIAVNQLPEIKNRVKQMIDLTINSVNILKDSGVPVSMVENGLAILLPSVKINEKFEKIQKKYKLADNGKICHFFVMEHHLKKKEIINNFIQDVIEFYKN